MVVFTSCFWNKEFTNEEFRISNEECYEYFTILDHRLKKYNSSITHRDPLAYNYFCNIIQSKLNESSPRYKLHQLTPKCFRAHIKKLLLSLQSTGAEELWELPNMPFYHMPTTHVQLRSRTNIL